MLAARAKEEAERRAAAIRAAQEAERLARVGALVRRLVSLWSGSQVHYITLPCIALLHTTLHYADAARLSLVGLAGTLQYA